MSAAPCRDVDLAEWGTALHAARDEGFDFFDWLSAVDQTDDAEAPGFDVVCHLIDSTSGPGSLRRLLVRTRVPEGEPVPSLTALWAGAAWHERETHEMFGIDFAGFEDGTGLGMRPAAAAGGLRGHAAAQVVRPRRAGQQGLARGEGAGGER